MCGCRLKSSPKHSTPPAAIIDARLNVPTRYPNSLPDSIPARVYTQDAARDAVGRATEIVQYVSDRLNA